MNDFIQFRCWLALFIVHGCDDARIGVLNLRSSMSTPVLSKPFYVIDSTDGCRSNMAIFVFLIKVYESILTVI